MLFLSKVFYFFIGLFVGLFLGLAAAAAIVRQTVGHFLVLAEPEADTVPSEDDNLGDEPTPSPELAAALQDAQRDGGTGVGAPSEDRSCVTYH